MQEGTQSQEGSNKLQKFTKKKKREAYDELMALVADGHDLGPGLDYIFNWLHQELTK